MAVHQHGSVGSSLSNDAPTPGTCGYTPTTSSLPAALGTALFFCGSRAVKSNPRRYSDTDAVIHDPPKTRTDGGQELMHIQTPNADVGRTYPRQYASQDSIAETYGPCSKFHRCRNIGVLGDGLCVSCWDGTNKRVE